MFLYKHHICLQDQNLLQSNNSMRVFNIFVWPRNQKLYPFYPFRFDTYLCVTSFIAIL